MLMDWGSSYLKDGYLRIIMQLGCRIYCHRDRSDFNIQRLLVFWVRALGHQREVLELYRFFLSCKILKSLESGNAIFYEQLGRHVFYYQSTLLERKELIKHHFDFCRCKFFADVLKKIYYDGRIQFWHQEFEGHMLSLGLDFRYVDRKEGLMTLDLMLSEKRVYHITFWFAINVRKEPCIYIGALQGSYGGREIIHKLTKNFFGYRPKNFIFYGVQLLAQKLDIQHIYAVSNHGFYTNNHVRLDKKLKTSLDGFWGELKGRSLEDKRFFELPVKENRKSVEEIKAHKRNLYNKRYVFLDKLQCEFCNNMSKYISKNNYRINTKL